MELNVVVDSMQLAYKKDRQPSIHLYGNVIDAGKISCRFIMHGGPYKSKLEFTRAVIFDGSDPREVALAVKNQLVEFVKSCDLVPDVLREQLMNAVYEHHKQPRKT
jgi:hypothetical protein